MASLAEIRAKLKEQEANAGGNRGPQGRRQRNLPILEY